MNPDTIAAIERQDREIIVAGNDMQEALQRIVACGGRRGDGTNQAERNLEI